MMNGSVEARELAGDAATYAEAHARSGRACSLHRACFLHHACVRAPSVPRVARRHLLASAHIWRVRACARSHLQIRTGADPLGVAVLRGSLRRSQTRPDHTK